MFDQAGLVRETVKWDYEVTTPAQICPALDRALSVANSDPKGPVYLMLPREVLAERIPTGAKQQAPQVPTRRLSADPAAIEEAAEILARAQNPLIITASLGHNAAAVNALAGLAERFAAPVVSHVPKSLCLPTDHPMHMGLRRGSLSPKPMPSSSWNATCRGFQRTRPRQRTARSSIWGLIRSLHAMGSGIFLAILRSRVIRRFHFRWSPRRLAGAKSTKTKSSSVAAA
jgi:hypothetical protein